MGRDGKEETGKLGMLVGRHKCCENVCTLDYNRRLPIVRAEQSSSLASYDRVLPDLTGCKQVVEFRPFHGPFLQWDGGWWQKKANASSIVQAPATTVISIACLWTFGSVNKSLATSPLLVEDLLQPKLSDISNAVQIM